MNFTKINLTLMRFDLGKFQSVTSMIYSEDCREYPRHDVGYQRTCCNIAGGSGTDNWPGDTVDDDPVIQACPVLEWRTGIRRFRYRQYLELMATPKHRQHGQPFILTKKVTRLDIRQRTPLWRIWIFSPYPDSSYLSGWHSVPVSVASPAI